MSQGRHTPEKCSELEEALKKCHVSAAAGQFAATVRHEINNPLEAIANLTYLIKLDPGNAAKVHEHSDQIDHYLAIAVRIARSTLSFYRAQDTMEAIEVAALAEAALRVQKRKLTAKQAKLVKDIAADAVIMGHAGELLQVLSNLISNSIDALPPNGRLTIRVRKGPREVHLTVADRAMVFPRPYARRFLNHSSRPRRNTERDLGLSISKSIIERHKGRIRARSSVLPGRSATAFRVSLPLHTISRQSSHQ
jgi:signal transduction histidine kinase